MKRHIKIPLLKYLNPTETIITEKKSYKQYFATSAFLFTVHYIERVKQCFGQFIPTLQP